MGTTTTRTRSSNLKNAKSASATSNTARLNRYNVTDMDSNGDTQRSNDEDSSLGGNDRKPAAKPHNTRARNGVKRQKIEVSLVDTGKIGQAVGPREPVL